MRRAKGAANEDERVCLEHLENYGENLQNAQRASMDAIFKSTPSLMGMLYGDLTPAVVWKMLFLVQHLHTLEERCTLLSMLTDYLACESGALGLCFPVVKLKWNSGHFDILEQLSLAWKSLLYQCQDEDKIFMQMIANLERSVDVFKLHGLDHYFNKVTSYTKELQESRTGYQDVSLYPFFPCWVPLNIVKLNKIRGAANLPRENPLYDDVRSTNIHGKVSLMEKSGHSFKIVYCNEKVLKTNSAPKSVESSAPSNVKITIVQHSIQKTDSDDHKLTTHIQKTDSYDHKLTTPVMKIRTNGKKNDLTGDDSQNPLDCDLMSSQSVSYSEISDDYDGALYGHLESDDTISCMEISDSMSSISDYSDNGDTRDLISISSLSSSSLSDTCILDNSVQEKESDLKQLGHLLDRTNGPSVHQMPLESEIRKSEKKKEPGNRIILRKTISPALIKQSIKESKMFKSERREIKSTAKKVKSSKEFWEQFEDSLDDSKLNQKTKIVRDSESWSQRKQDINIGSNQASELTQQKSKSIHLNEIHGHSNCRTPEYSRNDGWKDDVNRQILPLYTSVNGTGKNEPTEIRPLSSKQLFLPAGKRQMDITTFFPRKSCRQ